VDYDSQPPTEIQSLPPNTRLLRRTVQEKINKKTLGEYTDMWNHPRAMNMGIANARGKYVFILNCDILMSPDLLEIVDGLIEEYDGRHIYWQRFDLTPLGLRFLEGLEWAQVREMFETDQVPHQFISHGMGKWHSFTAFGDMAVFQRRWLLNVGGFDERLAQWGFYDGDMCRRLKHLGYAEYWGTSFKIVHMFHLAQTEIDSTVTWGKKRNSELVGIDTRERKVVKNEGMYTFLPYRIRDRSRSNLLQETKQEGEL